MTRTKRQASRLAVLALVAVIAAPPAGCDGGGSNDDANSARKLFLIDMHVDTLIAMRWFGYDISQPHSPPVGWQPWVPYIDIPRMQAGGVGAVILGIVTMPYCGSGCPHQVRTYLDTLDKALAENRDTLGLARSPEDIERLRREGKIAALVDIEGAQALDGDVSLAQEFYGRGVRVITLAHFWSNAFAPSTEEKHPYPPGLTDKGRALVREMNRLGMIVDVSHTQPSAVQEAAKLSTRPILYSHVGAYGVCRTDRNARDEELKAVAATGGIAGAIFYPGYAACSPNARWETVLDEIDYMVGVIGVDHVGFGSDMDGFIWMPAGFSDVSDYPEIIEGLLARGYSREDVRKMAGENFLRVFREVSLGN